MNPYVEFVENFARNHAAARALPLGGYDPGDRPSTGADAPRALFFAPHPDDECIMGALPLRLGREAGMRIVDVAVTQGSNKERQAGRLGELQGACAYLGWDVLTTRDGGLERINPKAREGDPRHWSECVETIAAILKEQAPRAIFFPHAEDWNSTHIGVHFLLMDALATLDRSFSCTVVETEFWGAMDSPNLMVEADAKLVADLVAATAFHVKEVERNPYHLTLPAWMQDNVRRGGELVGGQGGAAPDFTFATLYRLRSWKDGALQGVFDGGRFLAMDDDINELWSSWK